MKGRKAARAWRFAAGVAATVLFAGGGLRAGKSSLGTTAVPFLELPVGGRGMAMGGAQAAASNDATALYYNPAGLAGIGDGAATLMHAAYLKDYSYEYAAVAQRLRTFGVLALGVQYLSYPSLDKVDNTGLISGSSLQPADMALSFGYAKDVGPWDLGFAGKYISSKIQDSATAFAADAGVRYRFPEKLVLGAAVANVGQAIKYDKKSESLPMAVRVGSAYAWGHLIPALDVILPKGAAAVIAAGLEYKWMLGESFSLLPRLGYNTRNSSSNLGGTTGINGGLGFGFGKFSVDYAYSPYGDLGDVHRLSLSFAWGAPRGDDGSDYSRPPARAVKRSYPVPVQSVPPRTQSPAKKTQSGPAAQQPSVPVRRPVPRTRGPQ